MFPAAAFAAALRLRLGAVRVPAGATERLEKLCRYAARPPIVHERLSLTNDGKVLYSSKRMRASRTSSRAVISTRW